MWNNRNNEVYTNGEATITLKPDGSFSASLHDDRYAGTYVKSSDGTTITFTVNGDAYVAQMYNGELDLPEEWNDEHGHGGLKRK
jgi:hypothetical protein